jgi:transposase
MKARVGAGGQLRDLVYAAPEELRSQLRRSQTTKAPARACLALRPGPLRDPESATKAALRALARRWHHLQAELDALDVELTKLVSTAAPALLALPGIGLDTAGQCW